MSASERLAVLRGEVVDTSYDRVLDALVREGLRRTGALEVAVVLALRHTLVVRATTAARERVIAATADPCLQVVAAEASIALDGTLDCAPLVARGVRSYRAVPLVVAGTCIGALAAYGAGAMPPREPLAALAGPVAARLAELAGRHVPPRTLIEGASRNSFAELRNLMQPLDVDLAVAHDALAILACAVETRAESVHAIDALRGALAGVAEQTAAMRAHILALEHLLVDDPERRRLEDLVCTADRLAHHRTKLVGGVRWSLAAADAIVDVAPVTCVGVLTHALTAVASRGAAARLGGGIAASGVRRRAEVELRLRMPLPRGELRACVDELADLADRSLVIEEREASLALVLPAA